MPHSKRAQNSRIPFEIVIFATLKSCRCFKQGIAMLPALYPDPLMLSCGFLPDEGTALLAVERFAPADFALIVKPCLIAVIMKLCKVVLNTTNGYGHRLC